MDRKLPLHQLFRRKSRKESRSGTIDPTLTDTGPRSRASVDVAANITRDGLADEPARLQTSHSRIRNQWQPDVSSTLFQRRRASTNARNDAAPTSWSQRLHRSNSRAQEPMLQLTKVDVNLSDALNHLTLADDKESERSSRVRFSDDVVERTLDPVERILDPARPDGQKPTIGRSVDVLDHGIPGYPRVVAEKSRYSEEVANRNMNFSMLLSQPSRPKYLQRAISEGETSLYQSPQSITESINSFSIEQAQQVTIPKKRASAQQIITPTLPLKDTSEMNTASPMPTIAKVNPGVDDHDPHQDHGLDAGTAPALLGVDHPVHNPNSEVSSLYLNDVPDDTKGSLPTALARNAQATLSVPGGMRRNLGEGDLDPTARRQLTRVGFNPENTVDTTHHAQYAPLVKKETTKSTVDHVHEEQIIREVHHHDVLHRVLPVKDVEVLPAKHFARDSNGNLEEISESEVRERLGGHQTKESSL